MNVLWIRMTVRTAACLLCALVVGVQARGQCCVNGAWTQAATTGPSARYAHAMAYDAGRGKTIMFGGFDNARRNDTWEYDGATSSWVLASVSGPSPRTRPRMAYDAARARTVLFGGHDGAARNDTWLWDGNTATWVQAPGPMPSARHGHMMAYDPIRQRVVMFGGRAQSFALLGDTWEWNGMAWNQVASTGPAPRETCAGAFDPARGTVVIHGGNTGSTHEDDTWEWNGSAWSLVAATGPGRRSYHAMAPDASCARMLLFGGSGMGPTGTTTWGLTGNTWAPVTNAGITFRNEFTMVLDTQRNRTVAFGGFGNSTLQLLQDTWEFHCDEPPCCCPDGSGPDVTTHLFRVAGVTNGAVRTWRVSFPGGEKCTEFTGVVALPANSPASTFARHLAGRINRTVAFEQFGTLRAGWAPASDGDDAYVFIRVFGCAAGVACPMELCLEPDTGAECCLPAGASCPGSPSLERVTLSGVDCNANQLDDLIDSYLGVLTDENDNNVYDQCEGYCISAPLGFPFTVDGDASVTCGVNNAVNMGLGNGGINMLVPGFDSFGFEFAVDSSGDFPIGVSARSRGALGANPDQIRGSVSFSAIDLDPVRFNAFADYGPSGATQMIVRLIGPGGELVSSATFANNAATPLVAFDVAPTRLEMDRRIIVAPGIERRAGVLGFDDPTTVSLLKTSYPGVARVEFVAAGNLQDFGPLASVLFEKGFSPLVMQRQYFRMPDGTIWRPRGRTALSVPEGSSNLCAEGSTGSDRPLKSWRVESEAENTSRLTLELERGRPVVENSELLIRFIAIPVPAPDPEDTDDVDPLEFKAVPRANQQGFTVSVDLPLCIEVGDADSAGEGSSAAPVGFPCDPIPAGVMVKVCPNSAADPCVPLPQNMFAPSIANLGTVSEFPSTISEGVDHGILCATYIFRSATPGGMIEYDFGVSGGPTGAATDNLSVTFVGLPAPASTYSSVSAVHTTVKVNGMIKSEGAQAIAPQGAGCGDYNGDQFTTSQDFFDFIADFFSLADQADFNLSGTINSEDFFDFLVCFFAAP